MKNFCDFAVLAHTQWLTMFSSLLSINSSSSCLCKWKIRLVRDVRTVALSFANRWFIVWLPGWVPVAVCCRERRLVECFSFFFGFLTVGAGEPPHIRCADEKERVVVSFVNYQRWVCVIWGERMATQRVFFTKYQSPPFLQNTSHLLPNEFHGVKEIFARLLTDKTKQPRLNSIRISLQSCFEELFKAFFVTSSGCLTT